MAGCVASSVVFGITTVASHTTYLPIRPVDNHVNRRHCCSNAIQEVAAVCFAVAAIEEPQTRPYMAQGP